MADEPISLTDYRHERDRAGYDGLCCPICGSAWWTAKVTFDKHGEITGRAITAACADCGRRQDINPPSG